MIEERSNRTVFITGMREVGKTTYAKYLGSIQQQKELAIDTYDHPGYREFKEITLDELAEWSVTPLAFLKAKNLHRRRIFKGDILENVIYTFTVCFDTHVILEDASKIFDSNVPRKLKSVVIDHRNRGLDVLMMFHAYADIAPYLCRMWNSLVTFRTEDDMTEVQKKWSVRLPALVKAQEEVRSQANPYYKTVIHRE